MAEKEKEELPEKIKNLISEIENLSALELAKLVKALEEKFGISGLSAMPFPVQAIPQAGAQAQTAAPAEEKTSFTVVLTQVGANKIEAIKLVKEVTQKGLKDAKDLVDQVANLPQVLKENVDKEEAQALKEKFEKIGCKVELR